MPTADSFSALGKGNGFPFCCIPISETTNDPWKLWDLCPETFTREEVMNWFWNGHDYTSTKISYGSYRTNGGALSRTYTWYLNYDEADAAWSARPENGTLPDIGQGLNFPYPVLGSGRDTEPYKRVCSQYGVRLMFSALAFYANGTVFFFSTRLLSIQIVYDSVNDNYRFLVQAPYSEMGTEKYVEDVAGPINDTETFSIPITASKNISVPMATRRDSSGSTYNFISTTTGSLDFYTYT